MKTRYTLIAVAGMALAGCASDEPAQRTDADGAAVVSAEIAGVAGSRAYDTSWEMGDQIGISSSEGSVVCTNVPYVTADGSGAFTAAEGEAKGIFFDTNAISKFSAYYPYDAGVTAENPVITRDVTVQSSGRNRQIDFLFAEGARGAKSNPAINFTGAAAFTHRMAQLVLNIVPDKESGFVDTDVLADGVSTLSGLAVEGQFNTLTGVAEATGEATDWLLSDPLKGISNVTPTIDTTSGGVSFTMLVYPQQVSDGVTYSIDYGGASYSCTLTPALEAGKRYTYHIKLSKTGLTVANSTITDWQDDDSADVDTSLDPLTIMIDGHEAVLMRPATATEPPLYVATCNIGAEDDASDGTYFWWGDVVGHTSGFEESNPEIITNGKTRQELYEAKIIDADGNLRPEYDAATVQWGSKWRMPTHEDLEWLADQNNCKWIKRDGDQYMWIVTSKYTGQVIHLRHSPGYMIGTTLDFENSIYGGATVYPDGEQENSNNDRYYGLRMERWSYNGSYAATRTMGVNIRPVSNR